MIELQGITRVYAPSGRPPVHALSDVSLRIERGEFVAVVGTSGSGKSTLMSIFGLLARPTSGRYLFDGHDVTTLSVEEQARFRNKRVGFVFQGLHLLPRTSALENVELPLLYSERTAIDGLGSKALAAVGLTDRMQHTPAELSGGQQQRVAIARALVNEPDIVLADEPTGNLDPRSALEVMSLFRELNRQGHTIVIVTHDMAMAGHAKRVARIENGRIVADRTTTPARERASEAR
ncbi:MAG: ABC transporter ATP-binding protein [Acidobacteria bacterium]|nr:ABC transporter ATP-binding protein [Acidobacteriota bacterium]